MGDNMFRLKDRKGADLCLGMTHEEIMTTIARSELRSYKQLPQIWYQIQTKFRDEPRPKSGLLRVRQFTMKDSYSFDIDKAGLDKSFDLHDAVYRKIFTRCGLKFVAVEADSGSMGGSQSQEFMVYTDAGEDLIASCPVCGYAANLEKATSRLDPIVEMEPTGDGTPELVFTPGCGAIADVAAFFKISPASRHQVRGVYGVEARTRRARPTDGTALPSSCVATIQVNETKLLGAVGAAELRTMQGRNGAILQRTGRFSGAGWIKPSAKPLEDWPHRYRGTTSLEGRKNMVCGANKLDYHLRNVVPGRDFSSGR
jgi:prolyl-tRNA synthetase